MRLYLGVLFLYSTQASQDPYFNFLDRINADCIEKSKMSTYNYIGNRDFDLANRPCIVWNSFLKSWNIVGNVSLELMATHSKCRQVRLENLRSYFRNSAQETLSGLKGPWCIVDLTPSRGYMASPCFSQCTFFTKHAPKEKKQTSYGLALPLINYNRALIDPIERYFKSYEWGDPTYYAWRPSSDQLSAEYLRIRNQIFYGAILSLTIIIVWIILCFNLRKKALASRRRRERALECIFNEKSHMLRGVFFRPAPN